MISLVWYFENKWEKQFANICQKDFCDCRAAKTDQL